MLLNKENSILCLVDVQEKLIPYILNKDALMARCEWLLRLATTLKVPILTSEQYTKGLGLTIPLLRDYVNSQDIVEKVHFSCMGEPKYAQRLQELNKNQLILIGIEAHVCVMQTALQLKDQGFEVYVVVDAVGSRNEVDLKYGLKRMKQAGVHLVTAEMVFFEWVRQAGTPDFKALSKEFLKNNGDSK